MNKHNKTETDSKIQRTNRWLPDGRGMGAGKKQVREIKRYKLSVAKYINHGDEMYSVGNIVNNYVVSLCGDML